MDEYSKKRAMCGIGFVKSGSSIGYRDNHGGRSVQRCNRLGCSTRYNSIRGTQIDSPEKGKSSRPSFSPANKKVAIGGSSRLFSSSKNSKKSQQKQQNMISLQETVSAGGTGMQGAEKIETSSRQGITNLEQDSVVTKNQSVLPEPGNLVSTILRCFPVNATKASGKCQVARSGSPKQISQRTVSTNPGTSSSSSIRHSITSRNSTQTVKSAPQGQDANVQRYRLRNLNCKSMSDIIPPGCSSSNITYNRRTEAIRKRYLSGESSSKSGSLRSGPSGPHVSLLERPSPQPASRSRSNTEESRMRLSEHGGSRNLLLPEPQTQFLSEVPNSSSSQSSLSMEVDSVQQSPSSGSGTSSTEVLSAPERIERDDDFTYEVCQQFRDIANLSEGVIYYHDQHRDMRMDIDNMSYEELLALEEKMGNVSTGLAEEELSNFLKRSIYTTTSISISGISCCAEDDVKCSICQEEYGMGDEVGKLSCHHRYHVACIHQWLRQKNWCPICKASASPS